MTIHLAKILHWTLSGLILGLSRDPFGLCFLLIRLGLIPYRLLNLLRGFFCKQPKSQKNKQISKTDKLPVQSILGPRVMTHTASFDPLDRRIRRPSIRHLRCILGGLDGTLQGSDGG